MAKITELNRNPYKYKTRDWYIVDRLRAGKSRKEVLREFFPQVGETPAFTYSSNVNGSRIPKARMDQYRLFINSVTTLIKDLEKTGYTLNESYSDKRIWIERDTTAISARRRFIFGLVDEGLIKHPDSLEFKNVPKYGSREELEEYLKTVNEPGVRYDPSGVKIVSASGGRPAVAVSPSVTGHGGSGFTDPTPGQFQPDPHLLTDPEPEPEEEKEPEPKPKPIVRNPTEELQHELDLMLSDLYRARGYVIARELAGESLDFVSTRAVNDSCRAVLHGVKRTEIMHAVTITWPEDSKNEFRTWTELWKPTNHSAIETDRYPSPIKNSHRLLGYAITLAKARVPIMLVGPSGCGKSFLARDLADALELDYGEVPLTAGATPSWLAGAQTVNGYISRPFVDIYESGGVFCFEEIDAADSNMLLLVNNAIANASFFNPVTGKEILKHKTFIACATANTWGIGANRLYTGRVRLDAATLDRFRVGRVEVDYDPTVERAIVDGYKAQANRFAHMKVKV